LELQNQRTWEFKDVKGQFSKKLVGKAPRLYTEITPKTDYLKPEKLTF
jgi:hypothetical protein